MCTFTNSEDRDEMPHNVTFHWGLQCLLLNVKHIFKHKNTIFCQKYNHTSLDTYHGHFQVYCIKSEGRNYEYTKG